MTNHNVSTNPWPGITSYEDPAKSQSKLKFCGRDNDIYDMSRLIDDNLLVILYGKSGIGKTSLLNAGVFPALRKELYVPVNIRLGTFDSTVLNQEIIVAAIEKAVTEICGFVRIIDVVEEKPIRESQQPDYLWNYFARHRFFNSKGQTVFPVIVLDQFEEVLRFSDEDNRKMAEALLSQIQYLVDESHALNDCIIKGETYNYDFNFRFVISIREDELYLLEDSIDSLGATAFKRCRYRLRNLSDDEAKAAILIPGKECINKEQKDAIVRKIIELSTRPVSGEIDTLLLSMVCAYTYDKKLGDEITLADLVMWKSNNPMVVYYQDAIKELADDKVHYIQRHLIHEDGSRKCVDIKEVIKELGESAFLSLTQGKTPMLVIGDRGQVELLHDMLAIAVFEERKSFEELQQKKTIHRKRIINIIVSFTVCVLVLIMQLKSVREDKMTAERNYVNSKTELEKREKKIKDEQRTIEKLEEQNKNEISIVTEMGINLLNYNEYDLVQRLLLGMNFTPEIERLFRETVPKQHGCKIISDPTIPYFVSFNDEGDLLYSVSKDAITVWDIKTIERKYILKIDIYDYLKARYSVDDHQLDDLYTKLSTQDGNTKIVSIEKRQKKIIAYSDNFAVREWIFNESEMRYEMCKYKGSGEKGFNNARLIKAAFYLNEYVYIDTIKNVLVLPDNEKNEINSFSRRTIKNPHNGIVNWISFEPSPNLFSTNARFPSNRFVSSSSDGTIIVWDYFSGKWIYQKNAHKGSVNSACYSPNGDYIVTASDDSIVKVWNADDGIEVFSFIGHHGKVLHAEFSPDNRYIVSSSDDGTIRIWDFPPLQELIDQTRERFKDSLLASEERRTYYLE